METKLLPCPFCGCEPRYTELGCCVYIRCDACDFSMPTQRTEAEAIEAWNTRQGKTCDRCKHLATSMRIDYHIDPCLECVRNAPDLYEPKEDTDA